MTNAILTLNAGSSSIKFSLFTADDRLTKISVGQVSRIGLDPFYEEGDKKSQLPLAKDASHAEIMAWLINHLKNEKTEINLVAAGHRVVHGGQKFTHAIALDNSAIRELEALIHLAPNHQPHNLSGIKAVRDHWPELPQMACFDTSFHRGQPKLAELFPLTKELTEEGIIRYGFHGLSYAYIASILPEHLKEKADGCILVLHLGHGCSICALKGRGSIATTMGFTSLGGVMMGKRCGDIDPGILLYLMREKAMDATTLEDLLNNKSGLLGMSGISDDMRDLLNSTAPDAETAVGLFVHRIIEAMGSLIAEMEGLDAIIFTAGIGENNPEIRARILKKLSWLGIEMDDKNNAANAVWLTNKKSKIPALALKTNEELMIAKETKALLS